MTVLVADTQHTGYWTETHQHAIVGDMLSLLLYCVLFAVWVYLILEPLTRLWNRFGLWFGTHVVSKRDHDTHTHAWVTYHDGLHQVCTICGKVTDPWSGD